MAFYIRPPNGNISLSQLYQYGKKRLVFLQQFALCNSFEEEMTLVEQVCVVEGSECLIEGTTKDRVSHFILRMACSKSKELASFFIKAETSLFQFRLKQMNLKERTSAIKTSLHQVEKILIHKRLEFDDHRAVLQTIRNVLQYILVKRDMQQTIKVPFQHALDFVKQRTLFLNGGFLFVPREHLDNLLVILFNSLLAQNMMHLQMSECLKTITCDHRINLLCLRLQKLFKGIPQSEISVDLDPLLHTEIDEASKIFPPCMQHIHNTLRNQHRLKHKARIQYTLYLKDIGLPLGEALCFWKHEYSQPAVCLHNRSGCCHSWAKDESRYTYNIRHLYGQEGCGTNYCSHSCESLQSELLGATEAGGCPFAHFDSHHLEKLINFGGIQGEDMETIATLCFQKRYKEACLKYLSIQLTRDITEKNHYDCASNIVAEKRYNELHPNSLPLNTKPINNKVETDSGYSTLEYWDNATTELGQEHSSTEEYNMSDKINQIMHKKNHSLTDGEFHSSNYLNILKALDDEVQEFKDKIKRPADFYKSFHILMKKLKP